MILPRLETILCDTDNARDLHYRVRYKVFCEATGFETGNSHRETDRFDECAAHFLLLDRLRHRWIGAMRLIHGNLSHLPLEAICRSSIRGLDEFRSSSMEMSRLSVVSDHENADFASHCFGDTRCLVTTAEAGRALSSPERHEPLVHMVWAAIQWGKRNDVSQVYGLVTAPLARVLKRLSIPATPAGTEVRFKGLRRPYLYPVEDTETAMVRSLPQYRHLFEAEHAFIPYSGIRTPVRRTIEAISDSGHSLQTESRAVA